MEKKTINNPLLDNRFYREPEAKNEINMKTFKCIGTALLTVVLGMNLLSCSSNDDNDNNDNGNGSGTEDITATQKYITHRVYQEVIGHNNNTYEVFATYDAQNRLIKITEDEGKSIFTIDYDTHTMNYTSSYGYSEHRTYSFTQNKQGYITEIKDLTQHHDNTSYMINKKAIFTYQDNHLVGSVITYNYDNKDYKETTKHEWKDGNLVHITCDDESNLDVHFTYTNIQNKGNIQPYYGAWDNSLYLIFPSEQFVEIAQSTRLFGNLSKNLPATMDNIQDGDISSGKFTYKLDADGYVYSATNSGLDGKDPYTETGFFTYKE